MALKGEFAWDGSPPDQPVSAQASLMLNHLYQAMLFIGEPTTASGSVPANSYWTGLLIDEYATRVIFNSPGCYVKDVTYGTESALNAPLRLGSAPNGAGVKVILARDGGGAAFSVSQDSKPAPFATVHLFPADVRNEAELQSRVTTCVADQNGACQTGSNLAPGKYLAIALPTAMEPTQESVGRLWRLKDKAVETSIAAGKTAQVTLERADWGK